MKINVLEPSIFNRIAAGEVVERPASIVKELVENSIDAGATKIVVEITEGGIKSIRVSDNGCGIEYDQMQKAFLPHATSKISSVDDLNGIKTLGFRGEALASIGSVAEVVMVSKTKDNETAGKIEIDGGKMSDVEPYNCSDGTQITVNNIFFNVPARAKFLKKPKTEESEITFLIEKFILANPCVAIEYVANGKTVYRSSGKGMQDALFCIYGKSALENTHFIEKDYDNMKIYGYVSKPTWTKPNKTYQTLVLNNRYIVNSTVASAVHNAFGDFLMKRQFPFYCLYIDMDFEAVDVNVHPNKLDVRFENGSQIYYRVFETINRALNSTVSVEKFDFIDTFVSSSNKDLSLDESAVNNAKITSSDSSYKPEVILDKKQIELAKPETKRVESVQLGFSKPIANEEISVAEPKQGNSTAGAKSFADLVKEQEAENNSQYKIVKTETKEETQPDVNALKLEDVYVTEGKTKSEISSQIFKSLDMLSSGKTQVADSITFGSRLLNQLTREYNEEKKQDQPLATASYTEVEIAKPRVIGTLFSTYILVQYENDFLIIDQHAGHERLLYDKLKAEIDAGKVTSQSLMLPYVIKTNALEEDFLKDNLEPLRAIGFDIDEFGKGSFKVSEVPFVLSTINLKEFFGEILSDLKVLKQTKVSDILKDKLASMACKSAVKGGDALSMQEVEILLKDFTKNDTTMLCPHGRPVVVKFTKTQIEKMFKRIV